MIAGILGIPTFTLIQSAIIALLMFAVYLVKRKYTRK